MMPLLLLLLLLLVVVETNSACHVRAGRMHSRPSRIVTHPCFHHGWIERMSECGTRPSPWSSTVSRARNCTDATTTRRPLPPTREGWRATDLAKRSLAVLLACVTCLVD